MSAPVIPVIPHGDDPSYFPPEAQPKIDHLITEDDTPVDSIYVERQEQLLVSPLYDSWVGPGEGRTFIALANVGLFGVPKNPAIVPDALLSLDVRLPANVRDKEHRSYFVWEFGKPPDVSVEIVSNLEGDELGNKVRLYSQMGISYYVVWDPLQFLGPQNLRVFELRGRTYHPIDPAPLPQLGLGLQIWHGRFRDVEDDWLRWVDANGTIIPTGGERAEQERQRADQAQQRADKLAAQLRALGIEPPL
jgi:Uma2 family endonuclease